MVHKSVLLHEAIEGLEIKNGDTVIDATFGAGGHSESILNLGKKIKLIVIDISDTALKEGQKKLNKFSDVYYINENFRNLDLVLNNLGIEIINKALFDLGFSSDQLEYSGRGFSFLKNEPLLMTLGEKHDGFTARDIVNDWDEENIETIIRSYGEERFAKKIARAIISRRKKSAIETTFDQVEIINSSVSPGYGRRKIHPATKTFQALRIAVNDELRSLEEGLSKAFNYLHSEGRVAAISFHSLEDRTIKNMFRNWQRGGLGILITKKPIRPSMEEKKVNPRARSAKLRIIAKK